MAFCEIVGHRAVITLLSRAIARGSLPPSLLLTGPEGVGKRFIAHGIAQAMNCATPRGDDEAGAEMDACGACSVCGRIARGTFPDVLSLEPTETGALTIDQVRAALDQVGYRPFEARRRVVVIDQADLMVAPAQNALLKTLEEPPASTQFVLVTARPDMLLDTVRSRCPQLRCGLLSVDDIIDILTTRFDVEEGMARPAAASAGGSVGRALTAASGELVASREVAVGLLEAVAGARDARSRLAGAKVFATGKGSRRAPAARQELRLRLQALTSLLRDIEALSVGARVALANADLGRPLGRLVSAFADGRSRRAFSTVDQAIEAVDRNASPKVVADWLACQL